MELAGNIVSDSAQHIGGMFAVYVPFIEVSSHDGRCTDLAWEAEGEIRVNREAIKSSPTWFVDHCFTKISEEC